MGLVVGHLVRGKQNRCSLLPLQAAPSEPQTVLDALQQRLNKYREASVQARASGDERKARMHERIAKVSLGPHGHLPVLASPAAGCSPCSSPVLSLLSVLVGVKATDLCPHYVLLFPPLQQYQDAIRLHRAGRKVDFAELPVPPGEWAWSMD